MENWLQLWMTYFEVQARVVALETCGLEGAVDGQAVITGLQKREDMQADLVASSVTAPTPNLFIKG